MDAAHADLTEGMIRLLDADGREVATEVSVKRFGDRGAIDMRALVTGSRKRAPRPTLSAPGWDVTTLTDEASGGRPSRMS